MQSLSRVLLAVATTLLAACASAPPPLQGPRPAVLADVARLKGRVQVDQILRDTPEAAALEPRLTLRSTYLTPRFEFEQAGTLVGTVGGRVWLRSAGGVFAVQAEQVRYTLDKR